MKRKKKQNYHTRSKILAVGVLVVVAVGLFASLNYYRARKETIAVSPTAEEKKIIYPAQYSDAHITDSAKVSDKRFSGLFILNRNNYLANVISSVKTESSGGYQTGTENGTWLWTPILEITPTYQRSIISGAKKRGIKNIYLSIDSYLDIYAMADGKEKDVQKKAFDARIESFIKEARANGMTVDAEGGWRNWAEMGHAYKAFAVLNYAINFNKTHNQKLRGVQFDIEPYLLSAYKIDKTAVLGNFVNLIDEIVARLNKTDLLLSVVVPEFYDNTNDETPQFFYAGKKQYAFDHLLDLLDRRAGSKIIIMSYRNIAKGDDGSIDISKYEISKANEHSTKIVIAQETGEVNPPYVTFYNTSYSYYQTQLKVLKDALGKNKSFGGIATHYANAFLALK